LTVSFEFLEKYLEQAGIRIPPSEYSINGTINFTLYRRYIVRNKEELEMEILKVSAKSNPNSVAGALAGVLRERGAAEIQAIGAGALNQAVKAVAIARGFVAPSGVDLICIPAFTDIQIDGEERTAIKLIVEPR
jgi:stage V sporulation protein S